MAKRGQLGAWLRATSALSGLTLAISGAAHAESNPPAVWQPVGEAFAQAGQNSSEVGVELFAPITQNDSSLLFVSARGAYTKRFNQDASLTVGGRAKIGGNFALGLNVGVDSNESEFSSHQQQSVNLGLEAFSSIFDAHFNYRLPLSHARTIAYLDPKATPAALVIDDHRLVERYTGFDLKEVPLRGLEGELGVRLPISNSVDLRFYGGGFRYTADRSDNSFHGFRSGAEINVGDRSRLNAVRFTIGGEVQDDNRFGTSVRGFARLAIPLGHRESRPAPISRLEQQMGDRVRRDFAGPSGTRFTTLTSDSFARDARTGQEFGGIYFVSGTGTAAAAGTAANPTTLGAAVPAAGANGVVVVLGGSGDVTTPGVTLTTNQYLLGGGSSILVKLSDGSLRQFGFAGTSGTIVGTDAASAAVTLGEGSVVRGLTIGGAGTGILANGVGGFQIANTTIADTGGIGLNLSHTTGPIVIDGLTVKNAGGAGVAITGGDSVTVRNSTIGGGAGAIDATDGGDDLQLSLSNLKLSSTDGTVLNVDGSGAGTVTVKALSGIAIAGGNGETGGFAATDVAFDSDPLAGFQTVVAGTMTVGSADDRVGGFGVALSGVTGLLTFNNLTVANDGGTGLLVDNDKSADFTLTTLSGDIDTVAGTAIDLDPLKINLNFSNVSSIDSPGAGVVLDNVQGVGPNGLALQIGKLTVDGAAEQGVLITGGSTGAVIIGDGSVTGSGGAAVQVGEDGVAGSGGTVNLLFGADIDQSGVDPALALYNIGGKLNFTGAITGSGGIVIDGTLAGSAISIAGPSLEGTTGPAISIDDSAGTIQFTGTTTIANPLGDGIVIGNVPGGVLFGDVDITGLGAHTGLDLTGTHGNVVFSTLDISGTGAPGSVGIDLTGSTNAGDVIIANPSVITGVDIGVNLTNASMSGTFRYGDGNANDGLESTISANTPLVIEGLNGSQGTYNFADVNLVGDLSNLTVGEVSVYYVEEGATGTGTRDDPGSLADAEAADATYIVLLNDPAGGQDVIDAASAGGSFDLDDGQHLVSFLNGDTISISSTVLPSNLIVSGLPDAEITNPFAGSGSAILTSSTGAATVNMASDSVIDGVVVDNAAAGVGVSISGVSNASVLNSDVSGANGAISITDGGTSTSALLSNVSLSSSSGTVLSADGSGAGTVTLSGSDIDVAATGTAAAISLTAVAAGSLGFGTITAANSNGPAVSFDGVTGGPLTVDSLSVLGTTAGAGLLVTNSSATMTFSSVSVAGSAGDGIDLIDNNGDITIGSATVTGAGANGIVIDGESGNSAVNDASVSGSAGDDLLVQSISASGAVTLDGFSSSNSGAAGIDLVNVDGTVTFTGTTTVTNPGTAGIILGSGSGGTITFGDTDIKNLGDNTTGLDATGFNSNGTVVFKTLDITGASTTGTKGIDLTGAVYSGSIATTDSGTITGVGIGVDMTNAAITGIFRYGDGSNTDADGAASTISATTPLIIAGMSPATGTYNFADVKLVGDTNNLESSATIYYVIAGGTGDGSRSNPGNLAGAEAANVQYIVLLNNPAGGQDTIDAATAGGALDLDAGQTLFSFLNTDTMILPGGVPNNVVVYGIAQAITNPYTGSGAPILTATSGPNVTVNVATNTIIDGVVIQNAASNYGIFGAGAANVIIRNSNISGAAGAINFMDGGAAASLALSNLNLTGGSGAALQLFGGGGGSLTVTNFSNLTVANGGGNGILASSVIFDSDLGTPGYQTVDGDNLQVGTTASRVQGVGLSLGNVSGALSFDSLNIANNGNVGLQISNSPGDNLTFTTLAGSVDTVGSTALSATASTLNITLGSITVANGSSAVDLDTINGSITVTGTVSATNITAPAIRINNMVGTASFGALDVSGGPGGVLSIQQGASITGALNVTVSGGTASTSGNPIFINNLGGGTVDLNVTLASLTTLAPTNYGIRIVNAGSGAITGSVNVAGGSLTTTIDTTYLFNTGVDLTYGGSITANSGNSVDLSGTSGDVTLSGTITDHGDGVSVNDLHSGGSLSLTGSSTFDGSGGIDLYQVASGASVTINAPTISNVSHAGIKLTNIAGIVSFTGTTTINNPGSAGIELNSASGTITFGDTDITGLGTGIRGVDARAFDSSGTVTFNTLDITGASTTATRGIDLTGASYSGSIKTIDSGTITGVGIGVDLTNAHITGTFQYGDGSNTDTDGAASTISATTPIVIAGMNGTQGTYNFEDVNLVGNTSQLESSATVYYVIEGGTGDGSRNNPGSLSGAEASGANYIVLLNNPAGSQDTIDAASAGGSLDLAAGQILVSFLNQDSFSLPGGAPTNLLLYGIITGIQNPYAGSGAPILTTTNSGSNTVNLATNTILDGLIIQNAGNAYGVFGSGAANVIIRNSTISGQAGAISFTDGGAAASIGLSNLTLTGGNNWAANLNGNGAGTLTITDMSNITVTSGLAGGIIVSDAVFDSDLGTAGYQTVDAGNLHIGTTSSRIQNIGFYLANVDGALSIADLDIANNNGTGLRLFDSSSNNFTLTTLDGTVDTTNGSAVAIDGATLDVTLADVIVSQGDSVTLNGTSGTFTVTGAITATNALNAGLSVTDMTGTVDIAALNVSNPAQFGSGLRINQTIAGTLNLNIDGGSVSSSNGTPILIQNSGSGTVNLDVTLASVSNSTPTGRGFLIQNTGAGDITGTLSVAGGSLTTTLSGLYIGGGSLDVSYGGSITATSGNSIDISGTDGTVFLSGTIVDNDGGLVVNNLLSGGSVSLTGSSTFSGFQGITLTNIASGASVSIDAPTINNVSGKAITLANIDGTVTFTGTTTISNPGTLGIILGADSSGTITFGDVDIANLGANTTGLDAHLYDSSGTVTFNTLDITGTSTTGTRGIDLRGAVYSGSITTTDSGTITGVGIGADLTNAAITGSFQYGDGSKDDADHAASTISATTPIVIAGMNGGVGTYNFADVNLVGDTSNLSVSAYYVKEGAHGVGTVSDPGDLAGAEASGATYIILLNDPTGGQDTLDAASAGGTLDLDSGQNLLSFANTDTFNVGGGAPANLMLYNISTGVITNPFSGSGAPILTTTAGSGVPTVNLTGSNLIDGVIIANGSGGAAIWGRDVTGLIDIRNSILSGLSAIDIKQNGPSAIVSLNNLTLSASGGPIVSIWNAGAGTLTVTDLSNLTITPTGLETRGLYFENVIFDADPLTAGIQTVDGGNLTIGSTSSRVGGSGLVLGSVTGALSFDDLDIAATGDGTQAGLFASGNGAFDLTILNGTIDYVDPAGGAGVYLVGLDSDVTLSSVTTNGSSGVILNTLTGTFTVTGAINSQNSIFSPLAIDDMAGTVSIGSLNVSSPSVSMGGGLNVHQSTAGTLNLNIFGGSITSYNTPFVIKNTGAGTINTNITLTSVSNAGTFVPTGFSLENTGGGALTGSVSVAGGSITSQFSGVHMLGGSVDFTYGGNIATVGGWGGYSVDIANRTGGTVTLSGNISDNDRGIVIANNSGGTVVLSGASKVLNTGVNAALTLSGNGPGSTVSFLNGGLAITTTSGNGLNIAGGGTVNISGANNTISTGSGTAINISNATANNLLLNAAFSSVSNIAGTNGIAVLKTGAGGISGTLNVAGGSLTATGGTSYGVHLLGDSLNFTYGGNITASGSTSRSVEVASRTGGSATFSGNINDSGAGIRIVNNTGGTYLFSGASKALNVGFGTAVTISGNSAGVSTSFTNGGLAITSSLGGIEISDSSDLTVSGSSNSIIMSSGVGMSVLGGNGTINVNAALTGTGAALPLSVTGRTGGTATFSGPILIGSFGQINLSSNSGGTVNITGDINNTGTNAATGTISITGNTGGTFNFTGAVKRLNTGNTAALAVTGNSGTAISFTNGGLDIDTTTGTGIVFSANGNSTLTISGSGNTIDTTTGTGVLIGGGGSGGSGNVDINSAITVTGAGYVADINNRTGGTVTLSGNLTSNSGTGLGIRVSGGTGTNSVVFSGVSKVLNTGANTALTMTGNSAGSTLSFTNGGLDIDTTSGKGIAVSGGGDLTVSGSGNSVTTVTGTAVDIGASTGTIDINAALTTTGAGLLASIQGRSSGTVTLSGNLNTANTTGTSLGLLVQLNTGGTINFSGASKIISTGANNAIILANNTGTTVNFLNGGLDVDTTSGTGLVGGSGNITISGSGNSITTVNGIAVTLTGTGTVNVNADLITTGAGFLAMVSGRTGGTATLSGNLNTTNASGDSRGILVNNNTGGTLDFSGTSKVINTGANFAVRLISNTGATINFLNGGLDIDTTSATGFYASSGGTITVQGTGNTITSASGTALDVQNTTIGAAGLNFQSISSGNNTAAADPVNGIVLNNTGSSGGLTVTGGGNATLGGDGSGGTIQNTSGAGILLSNTANVSLTNMQILNTAGSGISGDRVNNFIFNNGTINGSGTAAGDSNIAFVGALDGSYAGITGTVSINNNKLLNAFYHGIDIQNYVGTISDLVISGNQLVSSTLSPSSQGSGIRVISFGTASTTSGVTKGTISNNTITNFPVGDGIQLNSGNAVSTVLGTTMGVAGSSTNIINVTGNTISGASSAIKLGGNAILAAMRGSGQANYNISNNGTVANPISNVAGIGIAVSVFGPMTVTAKITNNVLSLNNTFGSQGILVGIDNNFGLSDAGTITTLIDGNKVSNTDGNGIQVLARNSSGTINATITNNNVSAPLGGVRPGIRVDSGSASGNATVCLKISGNTSAGSGGSQGIGLRKQGTDPNVNKFLIDGMAATATPGVESYVDGLNPAGGGTLLISGTSGFGSCTVATVP